MDFCKIRIKDASKGTPQVYPDWIVDTFDDLMVRGGAFYAVWDQEQGMWSQNEFDVRRLVDQGLREFVEDAKKNGDVFDPLYSRDFNSGTWEKFNKYIRNLPHNGNFHQLDECLTFANSKVGKKDYASKRLPYALEPGRTDAWDELLSVLYAPDERDKIEWSIGAIVSGDSKWLQKFLVFYGAPGTGKSTVIDIFEKLFEGYVTTFEARALTSNSGTFAMETFEKNPLVALQHDGDLSRIEDNTRLNSIVGHDLMNMNVKYRSAYSIRPNAFLIIGTNKPVKIADAKAGNTRRLIDVHPTGVKIEPNRYHILVENVNYELGAIAHKCLRRYREMGKFYYENYIPTKMMMLTDTFYNFVEAHFDIFKSQDAIQLKYAWDLYKLHCEESNIMKRLQHHEVRNELSNYFDEFHERHFIGDKEYRSVYVGFRGLPEQGPTPFVPDTSYVIELSDFDEDLHPSAFNTAYPDQPAQEATSNGVPPLKWGNNATTLADVDTTRLHFVKVPEQHIVIDFDLVDEDGEKDLELNIERASRLPPTYTELSRSGKGLHLHYVYTGDVHDLDSVFDVGIEIKTLLGDSSLRRMLTKCNNLDIATLNGGLPTKEKRMLETKSIQSEKGLRDLIDRNLRKEIHPGTKPSIDFIAHILETAFDNGLAYDLQDMKPVVLTFAARSTHHSTECIRVVQTMKFIGKSNMPEAREDGEEPLTFFDVEVYPNLFIVCWKYAESDTVVRMVNPTADEIAPLFKKKLVGFNNRRYDNHILYARYMGYSIEELHDLSQRIINAGYNNSWGLFGEAFHISYADIFDFSSKKQGLKKFQIELGIHHLELDLPWDQPVPEGQWGKVEDYCVNDVIATEAVFESRKQDFVARQILAELSGLSVNHTTQNHTAKILFGDDKKPQSKFVYTDLSEQFPGYEFDGKESRYCGEVTGEGGYVYSEPGYYTNVALLDVASMHPTSIELLNLFGPYTVNFSALKEARMAIKHKNYERARGLLGGKLTQFLGDAEDDEAGAEALSYALKIVINIVYGLTSARFENSFRDVRNRDNIVAKRGALFMIDLKRAVQAKGFVVAHIKTDSIKIPGATPEIIDFVIDFGKRYGYDFEHETTYEKFLLINDAVYIARSPSGAWTAVGAQFQHPYVYKELFSHADLVFDDLCEVKNVTQGAMYLGGLDDAMDLSDLRHVGRTGSFMPVRHEGASLWRVKDGKRYHVAGTKGYIWVEREIAKHRDSIGELFADMDYFEKLKSDALKAIEKFVPYEELVA